MSEWKIEQSEENFTDTFISSISFCIEGDVWIYVFRWGQSSIDLKSSLGNINNW